MRQFKTVDAVRQWTQSLRAAGQTVGLVPTMGALHEGHLSLVQQSLKNCEETIATIFVNPTQFAAGEDLDKYPRTLEEDCRRLEQSGASAVFIPDHEAIYPAGFSTYVQPPEVAMTLEGAQRPEHFRGVTTIVLKLFLAIPATHAFFGKKDYQQLKVIEAMVRDLNVEISILAGEIIRDDDGLAMSSRNRYLDAGQRQQALRLSKALNAAEKAAQSGQTDVAWLEQLMRKTLLAAEGTERPNRNHDVNNGIEQIDYATIVDRQTLVPLKQLDRPAVALLAARIGSTRLIDNREL